MNQENEFRVRLRAAAASANARLGTSFSVNADRAGAYLEIANVLRDEAQRTGNDQYRQAAIRIEEQAEITRGKMQNLCLFTPCRQIQGPRHPA